MWARSGLGWEAAQLIGRAAPLAGEKRATAGLHAFARTVHSASAGGDAPIPGLVDDDGAAPAPDPIAGSAGAAPMDEQQAFSERELEIGRLILAGLTYKQIGQRLFISAKTVEHHVARMRQRLGVSSREELFDQVRAALDGALEQVTS